jgi:hypothetical protein
MSKFSLCWAVFEDHKYQFKLHVKWKIYLAKRSWSEDCSKSLILNSKVYLRCNRNQWNSRLHDGHWHIYIYSNHMSDTSSGFQHFPASTSGILLTCLHLASRRPFHQTANFTEVQSFSFSKKRHAVGWDFFLICIVGGGVQTGSTRHVGHWMAYCICPG